MRYFYQILPFFFLLITNLYAQNQVFTKKIILKIDETLVHKSPESLSHYLRDKYKSWGFLVVRKKFPQIRESSYYAKQTARLYEVELDNNADIEKTLHHLNQEKDIEYAEPIYQANIQGEEDSYYPLDTYWKNQEWYFSKLELYKSWKITRGDSNVVIGIIDTGFELDHIDLVSQWAVNQAEKNGLPFVDDDNNGKIDDYIGWDFGNDDPDVTGDEFTANAAHGTQVAGVASAQTDNNEGIAGVGFYSRLMPLKVYDNQSVINEDAIYEALVYGAENGCSVLNISLTSNTVTPLQWQQEVINYVTLDKGVLIVAAAGNAPDAEIAYYPASYRHVLSVSGVDRTDERITGYPYNTDIDLVAPSIDIAVTEGVTNYLIDFRGTSFATPLVAGAGALVKAKYPALTGLQIAELLRVTTDSVYHLTANQAYSEKLGYGRLNVYRALTEYDSAYAVRLKSFDYYTNFGKYAFREDTVHLPITFINYLQSIDNLKVSITANSPYVHFLKNSCVISDTILSLENIEGQFQFYLSAETPPETEIKFRLQYEASNYTDYEYFTIKTSPEYLINLNDNELKVTATSNGRIGYADDERRKGQGIVYQTETVLQDAGLMLGLSPHKLSSSVRKDAQTISQDFDIEHNVRFVEQSDFQMTSEALFTDNLQNRPSKIGVRVQQKVTTKNYGTHQNYTVIEYQIENLNMQKMSNLRVGIYADWQIGVGKNKADWDDAGNFGYVYEENGKYFGIKAFGSGYDYTALDKITPNGINISDEFSNAEKYIAISQGVFRKKAGYGSETGSDVAHIVGTNIPSLVAKGSESVTFVIAGANSLSELQQIFATASAELNVHAPKSPLPVADTILCHRAKMYVTPTNGTKFGFFDADDMRSPIYVGDSLVVTLADTAKTYYIVNLDSARESEVLTYQFKTYLPDIQLDVTDKINLRDSSLVHFYDHTPNVMHRIWDFGDGSKLVYDIPHPTHHYRRLGAYDVKLTITDSAGCMNSITKRLDAINLGVSPMPNLPTLREVCVTDTVHLAPDNGTNFKFYSLQSFYAGQPLHEGKAWFVTAPLDKVLIINEDSTLKSQTQVVYIDWGQMQPHFEYTSNADTLWNAFITFEDKTRSNAPIIQRIWDFGDGTVIQDNLMNVVSHIYTKAGIYDVTLSVTNSRGCTDAITYQVIAGSKSPTPAISEEIRTCFGEQILLEPKGGTRFNFYADSMNQLISSGEKLSINPAEYSEIYITNIDSVLESYPQKVALKFYDSEFDFSFPEPLQRTDFKVVEFKNLTKNPLESVWNFGDGSSSTEHYPVHRYIRQGTFTVTLKTTDLTGCTAFLEKEIRVFSESPVPQIDSLIRVCQNASVELKPTNGTRFNFYRADNLETPFYTGESLHFEQLVQSQTYYITNVDSILESQFQKVKLELSPLNSNFSMSQTSLDLEYADSIRIRADDADAVGWHWDFGNGQTAEGRTVFPKYETGGIYPITLTVTDSWGCQLRQTRTLTVVPKLVPASLDVLVQVMPNPAKDKRWELKLHFKESQSVDIQVFDMLGKELYEFRMSYYTKSRTIPFNMQNYPKGFYLLKLHSGDESAVRKIILD